MIQHSADLRIAEALKAEAEADARVRATATYEHKVALNAAIGRLILAALPFIVFFASIYGVRAYRSHKTAAPSPPQRSEAKQSGEPAGFQHDNSPMIRSTLGKIRWVDVDGDGIVNCVDLSIQFYNAYPDQGAVRFIWNNNTETGWNHLFVTVDGRPVETEAYLNRNNTEGWFGMAKYWGADWNPAYDRDVTENKERIFNDTYWSH
jgi:hypothetical protein